MAKTIYIDKLLRLTLTRKGRAVAKHPYLRENVIEAVKAMSSQIETDSPLWVTCKASEVVPSLARWQSGRYQ